MSDEYSVCQFFEDGTHEYVRRGVTAAEALSAATHYCGSVAVSLGMVVRVIITDGDDCICFEWRRGDGVVFP
jgi:hypothetical protein